MQLEYSNDSWGQDRFPSPPPPSLPHERGRDCSLPVKRGEPGGSKSQVRGTPVLHNNSKNILKNKMPERKCSDIYSGEGGIRTHGSPKTTAVFETAPFNHSGTSPLVVRAKL